MVVESVKRPKLNMFRFAKFLAAIAAQTTIVTSHARLFEASQGQLLRLAAENIRLRKRALEADMQARRELARELHDGPTQLVSALDSHIELCKLLLEKDPDKLAQELEAMQILARKAACTMRTLLLELRPLLVETEGLIPALELFLARWQEEATIPRLVLKVKSVQPGETISRRPEAVETALLAIVQEAVHNALKHARASQITIELEETPLALYIRIEDDGQGFEVERVIRHYGQRASLGLVNLRERAELIGGELTLASTPGQGTRITVCILSEGVRRIKQ
ncbi:MAG: ATP-binding protein [Chloroflexota bacterium]